MHTTHDLHGHADAARIARYRSGPSVRLVMLGFVLALGCVIGVGAALHPAAPAAVVASNTVALR